MKIFEIIVETQNNYSNKTEINYFFDVLERLLDLVSESEFLAGNNNLNINVPSSHPQDWKVYHDELKNTLKMISVCRELSIAKYPKYFDDLTIKKIDNLMTNCEIRFRDLPTPSLDENQQYMADNEQSSAIPGRVIEKSKNQSAKSKVETLQRR